MVISPSVTITRPASNKMHHLLFSAHRSVSDIQQRGPGRLSGWEEYSWSWRCQEKS